MERRNRKIMTRLLQGIGIVLVVSALWSLQMPTGVVSAQTRPTLDPSRQPLTALPIETVRAGLTATAAAPTAAPPTATPIPPTATSAPSVTPPLPNLGSGKSGPGYGLLLAGVIAFWLIGFGILRFASRRR